MVCIGLVFALGGVLSRRVSVRPTSYAWNEHDW